MAHLASSVQGHLRDGRNVKIEERKARGAPSRSPNHNQALTKPFPPPLAKEPLPLDTRKRQAPVHLKPRSEPNSSRFLSIVNCQLLIAN